MKRLLVLVGVCIAVLAAPVNAFSQDNQYLTIYTLIQEGDALSGNRQWADAIAKYSNAQSELQRFQRAYPSWNTNVVQYRLSYVATRINAITGLVPTPSARSSNTNAVAQAPPSTTERDQEIQRLQRQVRELQTERGLLEAKLREALSARPATVDPGQLVKAEEQVRNLLKENELLKVTISQQQSKAAAAPDTAGIDELKNRLESAERSASEQARRVEALTAEKAALERQLETQATQPRALEDATATARTLEVARANLAEQTDLNSKLNLERTALQLRLRTLQTEADAAAALRAENEILKKQVADFKAAPPPATSDVSSQLAEARTRIAALQSEKDILRLEKVALEQRIKRPAPGPAPAVSVANTGAPSNAQFERLTRELEMLRTRLAVVDAQRIPYTAEELALFNKPPPRVPGTRPAPGFPAGTATLVAEAQRDFASRRFDLAEEKYRQVLSRDEKNTATLANLAAIQVEMNRWDDAEKSIRSALSADPEDAYSMLVLGDLQFRRKQYDKALDTLSRAAQLDPRDSRIQNFLGLTLSEKGLRIPAERALRKAVELEPGYGSAHMNLAVVYATQKPPSVELARLHYQKARAAGMARHAELEKLLGLSASGTN